MNPFTSLKTLHRNYFSLTSAYQLHKSTEQKMAVPEVTSPISDRMAFDMEVHMEQMYVIQFLHVGKKTH